MYNQHGVPLPMFKPAPEGAVKFQLIGRVYPGPTPQHQAFLNGKLLQPAEESFSWGDHSQGQHQLAVQVCREVFGDETARQVIPQFEEAFLAPQYNEGDFNLIVTLRVENGELL